MSTFLQLCQKVRQESGNSGDGPASVLNQTYEMKKIVDWVADADVQIQTLWTDWNFLWRQHSSNLMASIRDYAQPTDLGMWNSDSFFLDRDGEHPRKLSMMDYNTYLQSFRPGPQTSSTPSWVVVQPNGNLVFHPTPDKAYQFTADYWKAPTLMTSNDSTSPIPRQFERVIITRAKMFVFDDSGDMEQLNMATLEFQQLLGTLESHQLPGQQYRTQASHFDMQIVVD